VGVTRVKTSEWLDAAADLIENDGWTRAVLNDGKRRCLVGALYDAAKPKVASNGSIGRTLKDRVSMALVYIEEIAAVSVAVRGIDDHPRITQAFAWNDGRRESGEVMDALRWGAKRASDAEVGGTE
jgi:hypothetical protein